jgi:hypothetical protein
MRLAIVLHTTDAKGRCKRQMNVLCASDGVVISEDLSLDMVYVIGLSSLTGFCRKKLKVYGGMEASSLILRWFRR